MAQDPEVEHPKQGQNPWNDNPTQFGVLFHQQPIEYIADKDGKYHGTCQSAAWNNCVQVRLNSDKAMDCETWKTIYGNIGKFLQFAMEKNYLIRPIIAADLAKPTDNEKIKMKELIAKYVDDNVFKCIQFSIKYRDNGGRHRVVMVKDGNQWWYLDSNLLPIAIQPDRYQQFEQQQADKEIHADLPYTGKVPDKFWNTIIDSPYFYGKIYVVTSKPAAANAHARVNDYGEILSNQYYDNEENNNKYIPIMNNDFDYNQYYQNQQQKQAQLLLSPPPQQHVAILPVQYGLNNGNNIYSQNEWLSVLLPILLIGACLFGIICIICTGFGGLFCYREGQKSNGYKYQQRDCKHYHKLPQRDVDDYNNKKDQGLAHYDENV